MESRLEVTVGSTSTIADGDVFEGLPRKEGSGGAVIAQKSYPVFEALPWPKDWMEWRKHFAIARLPRVDWKPVTMAQAELVLKEMGFAQVGGARWHHPDGSRVTLKARIDDGDLIRAAFSELGFQKWEYERLPLQVLDEWIRDYIFDDTDKWQLWLEGKNPDPPFSRASGAFGL